MIRRYLLSAALALLLASSSSRPTAAQTGQTNAQRLDQLSGDEFDKVFLLQMGMHQLTAVLVAEPAARNAPHQEIRAFAKQVAIDKTAQFEQMRSWARDWYSTDFPDSATILEGVGSIPTPAEGRPRTLAGVDLALLDNLWSLPPPRLEPTFLNLMIAHEKRGIAMAILAYDASAHQELKDLARSIETGQTAEIEQLNAWLASWYGL
jgi:uncharacterized protein (DUF305 family)